MIVPIEHLLIIATIVFVLGLSCVVVRRSLIMMFIGAEIMLNAVGLVLVGASAFWQQIDGQIMVFFLMAMASAEIGIALAMVIYLQRRKNSIDIRDFNEMRG